MADEGDQPQKPSRSEPPEYNVYRSRPRLWDRIRKPDLSGLGRRFGRGDDSEKEPKPLKMPGERPAWRKWLK